MDINFVNTAQMQVGDAQLKAVGLSAKSVPQNEKALRDAAESFEAVFIAQMLGPMFESLPTDGPFGGGAPEGVYRSMMVEHVGKSIAKNGGIGIADQVYNELLKYQEGTL